MKASPQNASLSKFKAETTFALPSSNYDHSIIADIKATLQKHSFARITGLISADEVNTARGKIIKNFNFMPDAPALESSSGVLMNNYRKLALGGVQQFGTYRPRVMRTVYNPIWAPDIFGLRETFKKMAEFRNCLYDLPPDFAITKVQDGLWTAARIHHYPSGGGFLIQHRDTVVPKVHEGEGLPGYYQLVLVLSKKGFDFESGGGYVSRGTERYFYEEDADYGDLVIYDGRTTHGVEEVDPQKPFLQSNPAGRMAGFVTLYRSLSLPNKNLT